MPCGHAGPEAGGAAPSHAGPNWDQRGAFIELTLDGQEPIDVGGVPRAFLEGGDEIVLSASAPAPDGTRIGSERPVGGPSRAKQGL